MLSLKQLNIKTSFLLLLLFKIIIWEVGVQISLRFWKHKVNSVLILLERHWWSNNFALNCSPNCWSTTVGSGNHWTMQLPFRVNNYLPLVYITLMWMGTGRKQNLSLFWINDGLAGAGGEGMISLHSLCHLQLLTTAQGWVTTLLCWGLCGMRATQPCLWQ